MRIDSHLSYDRADYEVDFHRRWCSNEKLVIVQPPSRLRALAKKTLILLKEEGVSLEASRKARGRPSEFKDDFGFCMLNLHKFFSLRELAEIMGVSHNKVWYHIGKKSSFKPAWLPSDPSIEQNLLKICEFLEREGWPDAYFVDLLIERVRTYLCTHVLQNKQLAIYLLKIIRKTKNQKLKYLNFISTKQNLFAISKNKSLVKSFEVVNVVGTAVLGERIDLSSILRDLEHIFWLEYRPEIFAAVVVHLSFQHSHRKEAGTFLVFNTGMIISTGFRSTEASERITNHFIRMLFYLGLISKKEPLRFVIRSIMTKVKFNSPIDIERLYLFLQKQQHTWNALNLKYVIYEPQIFPALQCTANPDGIGMVSMSIFSTGSVVFRGDKWTDFHKAVKLLIKCLTSADALIE